MYHTYQQARTNWCTKMVRIGGIWLWQWFDDNWDLCGPAGQLTLLYVGPVDGRGPSPRLHVGPTQKCDLWNFLTYAVSYGTFRHVHSNLPFRYLADYDDEKYDEEAWLGQICSRAQREVTQGDDWLRNCFFRDHPHRHRQHHHHHHHSDECFELSETRTFGDVGMLWNYINHEMAWEYLRDPGAHFAMAWVALMV